MKRFLAILFTVFYFGFSSGMVYNMHYCLDEVFLSVGNDDLSCTVCKSDKKNDCCKSEIKLAKTDVAPKANLLHIDDFKVFAAPQVTSSVSFLRRALKENYVTVLINAPPEKSLPSLFLTYCNFRI